MMKVTVFLGILAYLWSSADSSLTGRGILKQLKATYKPVDDADLDKLQLRKSHARIRPLTEWKNPCWFSEDKFLCVPYFYVMGFRKCATSDLYARLSLHPEVVQPWRKETYWLTERRKVRPMEDYADWFGGRLYLKGVEDPSKFIIGDGDPNVVWHFLSQGSHPSHTTPVPQLLRRLAPKADFRFILLMRDPAERVYSDYLYLDLPGKSNQRFHQEVLSRVNFYKTCFLRKSVRECVYDEPVTFKGDDKSGIYLGHSLYVAYLHDWLIHYPREQILLLETEDYSRNMVSTLASVIKFLGLDPLDNRTLTRMASLAKINRNQHREVYGDILPSTKKVLDKFFQPFNEALGKIWTEAGKDSWLKKSVEAAKEARREEAEERRREEKKKSEADEERKREEAKMVKELEETIVVTGKGVDDEKKLTESPYEPVKKDTTDSNVAEEIASESKIASISPIDNDKNEQVAKVDAISQEKTTWFDKGKEMQVTGLEKAAAKYAESNLKTNSHIPVESKVVFGGKERKHFGNPAEEYTRKSSTSNEGNSDPFVITNIVVDPVDVNKSVQQKSDSKLSSLESAVDKAIEIAEKTEELLAKAVPVVQENNVQKSENSKREVPEITKVLNGGARSLTPRYVGTKNGKPIGLSLENGKPVIVQSSDPVAMGTKSVVSDAKKSEVSSPGVAMETDDLKTVVMGTKGAGSTANTLPNNAGTKKEDDVVNVSFKNGELVVDKAGENNVAYIASKVVKETDKTKSVEIETVPVAMGTKKPTGETVPVPMGTKKTETVPLPSIKVEIPDDERENKAPIVKPQLAVAMATQSEKSVAMETKTGNVDVPPRVVINTDKIPDSLNIPRGPEYNHFENQAQIETNLAKFIDVPEKTEDKSAMNNVLQEIKLTESEKIMDHVVPIDENGKPLPVKVEKRVEIQTVPVAMGTQKTTGETVPVPMGTKKTEAVSLPSIKVEIPDVERENKAPVVKPQLAVAMAAKSETYVAMETKTGNVDVPPPVVINTDKIPDVQNIPKGPDYNHFENQAQIETNLAKFIDIPEKTEDKSAMNDVLQEIKLTESEKIMDHVVSIDENGKPLPVKVESNHKAAEFISQLENPSQTGKSLGNLMDDSKMDPVVEKDGDLAKHDLTVDKILADPAAEVEGVVMQNTRITKFKKPLRR